MLMLSEESWSVSPLAHALLDESCAENKNVPEVLALHTLTSVIVSLTPPFVHEGVVLSAILPAEAAAKLAELRVELPELIAVVPLAPGDAVCN